MRPDDWEFVFNCIMATAQVTGLGSLFFEIKGKGCPFERHGGMWRSGGVAPLIPNLGRGMHEKCYAFRSFARFNITWDITALVRGLSTIAVQWYNGMTLYSGREVCRVSLQSRQRLRIGVIV